MAGGKITTKTDSKYKRMPKESNITVAIGVAEPLQERIQKKYGIFASELWMTFTRKAIAKMVRNLPIHFTNVKVNLLKIGIPKKDDGESYSIKRGIGNSYGVWAKHLGWDEPDNPKDRGITSARGPQDMAIAFFVMLTGIADRIVGREKPRKFDQTTFGLGDPTTLRIRVKSTDILKEDILRFSGEVVDRKLSKGD